MITENYYNSHRALALGQTGLLGGAIGTAISSVASCALATGASWAWMTGIGTTGIGAVYALFLAGGSGLIQGATRYPVHYYLNGKLDTTTKKVMGLVLEFLVSTFVIWLTITNSCPRPLNAALTFSAMSFPISIIACTILGTIFMGLCKRYCTNSCG